MAKMKIVTGHSAQDLLEKALRERGLNKDTKIKNKVIKKKGKK